MCGEEGRNDEWTEVRLRLPRKWVEFLREFGEWLGYEGNADEFIGEFIIEAVETSIYGVLDKALEIAPLKVRYFRKKYFGDHDGDR